METIRKPKVIILYNNKDITNNISKYIQNVTYTDYEKDQSDELSITLNDSDGFFQNDWRPQKGDKIAASIGYANAVLLKCGTFTIDEPEITMSDEGDIFVIRSLAASVNEEIRQQNCVSYVNKTLVEIARKVGQKHGYTVAGAYGNIKIPYAAQYNETDIAFLHRLAESYGYIFKLTDTVITFTPAAELENAKSILAITRKDIVRASLRDSATKKYAACSAKYLSPKTGNLVSYTVKSSNSQSKGGTLKLSQKYATKEQAKAAAEAGLKNGSKGVTGSIDFRDGMTKAIAGVNINADFENSYSGIYHITQSTHTVTPESYTTTCEVTSA